MSELTVDQEILLRAEEVLRKEVAPIANAADHAPAVLQVALNALAGANLLALRRPQEYGGPAMEEGSFRLFQESVARVSGALAFLQTQHQSAGSMISKSENEDLKSRLLPGMGSGANLVGIGFSQLRRPGPPVLRATADGEGYRLTGEVPWITGHGFYQEFLIGASLEDGRSVFGAVPLVDAERDGGSIRLSPPMALAAMESAQTVSASLDRFWLPAEDVAFIRPADWIIRNDMINITLQGSFALGCAQAGIDIVRKAYEKRAMAFLLETAEQLTGELDRCRIAMRRQGDSDDERLRSRAWAIDLAVRCAHAAVTASSGAANSSAHDAQRVYREALVYTVSAQTTPVMEATLRRIVERGES